MRSPNYTTVACLAETLFGPTVYVIVLDPGPAQMA